MKDRAYKSIDIAGYKKDSVAPFASVCFIVDSYFV